MFDNDYQKMVDTTIHISHGNQKPAVSFLMIDKYLQKLNSESNSPMESR
jgi:hypothetical protein